MRLLLICLALIVSGPLGVTAQDARTVPDAGGKFMDVDGIELYVVEQGDPSGLAVLLVHGFGGSVVSWRFVIPALAEAGYHVVAFDRPPYGLADKRTDIEWDANTYNRLTVGLMDVLRIERAVLVGHSGGGGLIANMWAEHRDRISGLVFAAGAVVTGNTEADAWYTAQGSSGEESGLGGLAGATGIIDPNSPFAQVAVRAFLTPETLADIFRSTFYDQSRIPDDAIEAYGRILTQPGWEAAFLKLLSSGMAENLYTPDDLADIDVPTLLIWGKEDTWVPYKVGEALANAIPTAELITYELTGHVPMEERVEWFIPDLLAFLERAKLEEVP